MNIIISLLTLCAALFLDNVVAAPIIPKISGGYVVTITKICQSNIEILKQNSVIQNVQQKSGDISSSLFQIVFTPNKTNYAGAAVVSGYNDVGHELYQAADPTDVLKEKSYTNVPINYNNTLSTLYMSVFNGGGQTFNIFYANIDANNIVHNIEGIAASKDLNNYNGGNPNYCTNRLSAIRQ